MRVVIDISSLHPKALKRGVGFYSLNLFKALKGLQDNNQYFLKKEKDKEIKADVIHYPYFDPFFLNLPLIKTRPVVVTTHDLTPLKFPQHFPAGIKGRLKWQIQKISLKASQAVICDSENSKKDVEEITKYPKKKIYTIYLASKKEFKQLKNNNNQLVRIKEKYQLPNRFVLYAGDLNWNKNVKGLIQVIANTKKAVKNIKLVLVGPAFNNKNLKELKDLKKLINKLRLVDKVKILGFISTQDLVSLYNLAFLYIQPSFYEGFGLPVLEAMSCGCPVLCSNQASLPEVGGKSVEYFNPYIKNDFEKKLINLINNPEKLQFLSKAGLKQARKFSWKKTALKTSDVYKKVIKEL